MSMYTLSFLLVQGGKSYAQKIVTIKVLACVSPPTSSVQTSMLIQASPYEAGFDKNELCRQAQIERSIASTPGPSNGPRDILDQARGTSYQSRARRQSARDTLLRMYPIKR